MMRARPSQELEKCRIRRGIHASDESYGNNGAFIVRTPNGVLLDIIVSDGMSWEHVSVKPSREKRTPTWDEMSHVKHLFWEDDETVVQFHPKDVEHINCHEYVLHLWKPVGREIELPPGILVGPEPRRRSRG